jgi:hypothetical protein
MSPFALLLSLACMPPPMPGPVPVSDTKPAPEACMRIVADQPDFPGGLAGLAMVIGIWVLGPAPAPSCDIAAIAPG